MGAHGISAANASTMRSPVIVAVIALACAAIAQESSETVVPEMEMQQATGSGVGSKTVVQDHYEVEEVPQKQVIEKPVYENVTVPVETVHYVPVTKTIPVEKKVEVKEVVESKPTGCDLVVESCFASPSTEEVPAWKAPVLSYEKSYTTLCADEAAAKKAEEKKHKLAEKKTKEAAAKGVSAEKASKKLEKALKEAQVKCSEKSQKGEKTAKEVSKKGAEREEKLFTSEKDSKESAAKAISAANTREKIVYVPAAAPKIIESTPAPTPAPVVKTASTPVAPA